MIAARDGLVLMALMDITFVCATCAAETAGSLPSWRRTAAVTGALVTSCNSVCTSVGVTACTAPDGCTRSCAVAEYSLGEVSEMARLAAMPSSANPASHHFRRRTTAR